MNKKKILIIILIVIILVIIGIIVVKNFLNKTKEVQDMNTTNTSDLEVPNVEIDKNQVDYNQDATVDELKEYSGASGDSELYEVATEYDGRKVLKIKSNKLYDVAISRNHKTRKTRIF